MGKQKTVFLSLNVNGLGRAKKRREIFRYVRAKNPELVLLQETYSSKENENLWSNEWGRKIYFSHGTNNSEGVAILVSKNFQGSVQGFWNDQEGRFLALQCVLAERKVLIVNLYAPNEDSPEFFHNTFAFLDKENLEFEELIIAGDFNTTLNPQIDKKGSENDNHVKKRKALLHYIEQFELEDIWRKQHPDCLQFSWRRLDSRITMSRLDFFLISQGLVNCTTHSQIYSKFMTDHGMVLIEMELESNPRGPGYWKFNSLHLKDLDFVDMINLEIEEYNSDIANSEHTPDIIWEGLKAKLIAKATEFSIKKAKSRKNLIELLHLKLKKLDDQLIQGQENIERIKREIRRTEEFMLNEHEVDTLGAIFRSKSQFYALGEKPSAYFFGLEKSRARAKSINKLQNDYGEIIYNTHQITRELKKYYEKLYTSQPHNSFSELNNTQQRLNEDMKAAMDLPFTLVEVSQALKLMPNNKCPGIDGLTTEFYKMFWPKIKEKYFRALEYAIEKKQLHQTAVIGVISLLPKKDKNGLFIKNWRPITLMNMDYKIFSKMISLQLKEVMPFIIHEDQTGFMSGRDISLNIRRTLEVIDYSNKHDIGAVIMQIDAHKAFDSLETDLIWNALRFFNFGERFISYVQTLFTNAKSCVINNGWKTENFNITRSVKQGCSTAPFLFNICYEILAIKIRENEKIKGITINDLEHKISMFADDLTLFVQFEEESFCEVVKCIDSFRDFSGIAVNYDKTSMYRIGSIKNSNAKLYTNKPFLWTNNPISILGVMVSNDSDSLLMLNYAPVFDKVSQVCQTWQRCQLTLMGKVVVINNLVASLFTHRMAVLPSMTQIYLREYEAIIKNFLWGQGRPKIKLETLYNSRSMGGLGLINLENKDRAIKAQWVSKCKNFNLIQSLSQVYLPKGIWNCNVSKRDVDRMSIKSIFWKNVLSSWACFNFQDITKLILSNKILRMPLMYNSCMPVGGVLLSKKKLEFLGVHKIEDLFTYHQRQRLITQQELYNKIPNWNKVLQIMGIVRALPQAWIKIITGEIGPSAATIIPYDFNSIPKKITSIVYQKLTFKERVYTKLALKWSKKMGFAVSAEDLDLAFDNIKNIVSSTKLRDFQFRFLHRKIFTNFILYKWKIVESDRCALCHDHYETIEHLFFQCTVIKRFWTQLQSWYEAMTDTEVMFEEKFILFCKYNENKSTILDTIALMAKQYIFRCKCMDHTPNFYDFKDEMFETCKIERRIACQTNRKKAFIKKWSLFLK